MIIKHKIDAFLFEIFPDTKGMNEAELGGYIKIKINEKANYPYR